MNKKYKTNGAFIGTYLFKYCIVPIYIIYILIYIMNQKSTEQLVSSNWYKQHTFIELKIN